MNYNALGTSGIEISALSFGCMSLELEKGQTHINEILQKAYESGINFFDTADLYDHGENEKMVGEALKPFRQEVCLATKVGNVWREDGTGWDWKPTKELIMTEVQNSLERLQTDYLDLYMLHGGTLEDPIDEIIDAFEILKMKGTIRAYGISSIRPNVIREYVQRSSIDSVMMQYSLLDRRPEESCLELLNEHQISVLARGTLAKGLLIDKAPKAYLGHSAAKVIKVKEQLRQMGNPLSYSLAYVLSHPAVASAVAGIRTLDQLTELITQYPYLLTEEEKDSLTAVVAAITYDNHR